MAESQRPRAGNSVIRPNGCPLLLRQQQGIQASAFNVGSVTGLSPLARGNLWVKDATPFVLGPIPARAGES